MDGALVCFRMDVPAVHHWIQWGGYPVLFSLLFLCGVGLPLPEDIPLIAAGIMIANHHMHWAIAGPLAWAGIIGGDCVLYQLGMRYGREITRVPFVGRHITPKRLRRAEKLFLRYGAWVVAIGRLFAVIRGAMVVAAGTSRFKFVKFIVIDGLAAVVSGGTFMLIGFWFGENLDTMRSKLHEFKTGLTIFGIIAGIALILYVVYRVRKEEAVEDDDDLSDDRGFPVIYPVNPPAEQPKSNPGGGDSTIVSRTAASGAK